MKTSVVSLLRGFVRGERALGVHWRRRKGVVAFWGMLAVLVCAVLYFTGVAHDIPLGNLTRDPAAISFTPFYNGVLSNIGIMFWASAMAVWLLGAMLVRRQGPSRGLFQFFLASALFTLLLMLDDAIMFHDAVFPLYLGIDEKLLYAAYFLFMIFYFWRFAGTVLASEYLPLLLALLFFALSLGVDMVGPGEQLDMFVEDCFKFIGIVFWAVYAFLSVSAMVDKRQTTDS